MTTSLPWSRAAPAVRYATATWSGLSSPWVQPTTTRPLLDTLIPPSVVDLWLEGADRRAHGAEPGGLATRVLEGRPGVGVDELALRDVGVGPLNQQARVLALEQRAGDSPGPEINALAGVLRDLLVDDHVGDLEAAAGLEDAVDFVQDGVLVGHEVDDAVGDHDVDR